nr:eukaryotic release factor 3 (erfs) [Hymenolepis microstoma]
MSRHRRGQRLYSDDYCDYDNIIPSSVEEDSPISHETTAVDFEELQELDIETLLNFSKSPGSPDYVKPNPRPSIEKPNIRSELNFLVKVGKCQIEVQSASEPLKAASKLGVLFNQSRSLGQSNNSRFDALMVHVHRPSSIVFLHNPPQHCTVFKFDTERPLVFDNLPLSKPAVPPLPKLRLASKAQPIRQVAQAAVLPIRGIRLPKIASDAKIAAPPTKPPDRSALINAYEEKMSSGKEKEIINLVVVGHVDAGKSTLMGNVLLQLGLVSDKKFEKYKWESMKQGRSSFAYAWILDQTSEERSRGITMDIAQSAFETKTKRVILLDAPGHRDFIPQVIGGAACADVAILVVNATHGEYETGLDKAGGQTQEHARLMRLLGISRIIVAVNKMDTVDWSQARFEEIRKSMTAILKSINQTDNIFCPVSGLQGINIVPEVNPTEARDMKKIAPWYNGPTLLDIIDGLGKVERQIDAPFRFLVSDTFKTVGSAAPIIAGRVVSGAISSGANHLPPSKVVCLPSGKVATIRSIRPLGTAVEIESGILRDQQAYAFAGDQVGLTLTDVDKTFTPTPGDVVCDVDSRLAPVATRIRAKVLVFDVSVPLTLGSPVIFHHFCSSVPARITKLLSAMIKKKELIKPRVLPGRCTAEIELTLETPVCVELFDVCKPLGRFILRNGHESVAGGTIIGFVRKKELAGTTQAEGR